MRNTWAAYLVNITTGKIDWTLGGRHSSFKFGPGAEFQWQHDVAAAARRDWSRMFDDHCCQLTGGGTYVPPTGVLARARAQARPADAHRDARSTSTACDQASTPTTWATRSRCPNGNVFVGWGSNRYFSEYTRSGKLLLEGELPGRTSATGRPSSRGSACR